MFSRRIKIIILTSAIILSLSIMLFFVIKNFVNTRNLSELTENYEVKINPIDGKDNNLHPEVIINAIDIKKLNRGIEIKLDKTAVNEDGTPNLVYLIEFNQNIFQYIFLGLIIKTFPQWQMNDFIFHFNLFNNAVWVQYNTNFKIDYLNWRFKIVSKI